MIVRKIFRALYAVISSKVSLIWVAGVGLMLYILSAIWMKEAFGTFVMQLRNNIFLQGGIILLLLFGYGNFIRAAITVFKGSKIRFCAWILLPSGLLLFLSGFYISSIMRESGQIVVGVGDVVNPPWNSEAYIIRSVDPGLKNRFSNDDIHQSIFAYQPAITLADRTNRSHHVGAFPPARIVDTYYHILNFGIAPEFQLFQNDILQQKGHVPLKILVPGSMDFFEIAPLPFRFVVTMEPEKTVQKGRAVVNEFNLKNPLYRVTVYRGERIIAEGDSRRDVPFDNYSLKIEQSRFWVQLEAVKDSGILLLHAGIVLIITGIPAYLTILITRVFRQRTADGFEDRV